LFGIAAGALLAAAVYAFANNDWLGFAMLLGVALATALGGLVLALAGINDRAPRWPPPPLVREPATASASGAAGATGIRGAQDVPPLEMIAVDRSLLTRPSMLPFLAAVALGVFGVGLAAGHAVVIVGLILGVFVAAGWLAQCWREDPSFTGPEGVWISERLLAPFGFPLIALTLVGIIVLSVSRVLLAVPKAASVAIAFALAVMLLVVFLALARQHRVRGATVVTLGGFAFVTLIAAGSVSAASGYRTFEHPAAASTPTPTTVVAQGIAYKTKQITVTEGREASIVFDNRDGGTYHNIAVYTERSGGSPVWNGQPVQGVKKITYNQVFNVAPGTYTFRCDFHPTAMIGTFTVKAPGS
jgi:plastocyanin